MTTQEPLRCISKQNITIAATFTSEPIEDPLSFWLEEIGFSYSIEFAPYNQVFQELLNSASILANNQNGVTIILVRFEDWEGIKNGLQLTVDDYREEQILGGRLHQLGQNIAQVEQTIRDFGSALKTATMRTAGSSSTSVERTRSPNPYLVCICPPSPTTDTASDILHERMQELLAADLKNISGVYLIKSQELISTYPVKEYYNPHGDELGHIPYTPTFFCALGTMLARKILALKSSPYKVIALDCDYTLWSGICGEDGVAGVKIDPPLRALQEFIVGQQAAGKLICLCSKNQEEDVFAVFDKHQDMLLKRHHLVNWRINWQPKSENLKFLADELQLSLDSFIFIDDNPVECAEVRANCPEVLTLQLPENPDRIPQFLDHIWAFDQLQTTQEDQQRTNLYQQNVQRQRLQQDSFSFTDFLAQLNLEIEIFPMQPDHLSRVAQLTQRTNQFNLTTIRRAEAEIQQLCHLGRLECRIVQVKDRFGDYGLVGLLLFEAQEKALFVDTFLLSCRVLGRGVEHRMLAYLGTLARKRGLDQVELCYTPTKKNQPAWDFLTSVGRQFQQKQEQGWIFKFPSQTASECDLILISDKNILNNNSDQSTQSTSDTLKQKASAESFIILMSDSDAVANKSNQEANYASESSEKIVSPSGFFERIARNFYSPELILKEITSRRQRQRPELDIEFVAPRTPIEKAIANLFAETLSLDKVGIDDNFFELGGDSIRGAILINKLQAQLNEIVHFVVLFDTKTVAALAAYIEKHYPQALAKLLGEEIASTRDLPQARIDAAKVEQMRSLIPPLAPPIDDDRLKNPPAIFILSPHRSGSTLLRVILGGHPQLFAPPELELLSFNTLRERKAKFSGRYSFWLEGTIRTIMQIRECSTQEAIALMEELEAKNLTTKHFYQLIQQWLGDKTLVDKTPSYSIDLETLKRAERNFQNPLYIHLVRHPYATMRSYEQARLEQIVPYQHPFNRRELAELVWLISHQNILEFLQQVPQERQYQIRFEDLVSQPQTSIENICQFLGLEFHPEMLQPYNEKKQRMTDGIYTQSRMVGDVKFHEHQGIDASTADSWKQDYSVDFLSDLAWQVAESLGYEPSSSAKTLTTNGAIPINRENQTASQTFPLSFAQTRLWFLEQLQPNSALYTIPRALQLNGSLNYEALKLALNEIVARHESLRTTFVAQDGTPMQVIASAKTVELPVIDLSQLPEPEQLAQVEHHLKQQAVCPFDLSRDLMLRPSLLRLSDSQHILGIVMHHIASDGWSMGIFLHELAALYNAHVTGVACSLPELPIQYADYAHWQRQWLSSQVLDHQLNYWKQQLADAPPLLELPTDRVRPAVQTVNGATKKAILPAPLTQALKALSQQEGVTLFMTLLTAFNILLHRYSGQSDIVVGSPIAGRNQIETEGLIGFFVNTLALRTCFQSNPTFRDVLNQVRSVALGAYAHQDLPFEKLVEQLQTERDLSRTPVFQVMFSLQITPQGRFELQNITLTPLEIGNFTAKFDLILSLRETETGLQGRWDYNTDLFDGATIERMIGNFETLLEGIVAHPDQNVGKLPLLTPRERHQLLIEWNNTSREYPINKCIHQLFEKQVERVPDQIAAIFEQRKLTYREVNQKANQLAHLLKEKGVGKGKYIPVLMERSLELLLSYLAIMKTGAAFVPIDPKWPITRIREILRELNTEIFLVNSSQEYWQELSQWSCVVVNELELTSSQSNLNVFVNGTDPIYVMFTSGSTGKPKGAINQHRGLTNRFFNANDRYGRKNNDVFLFASNQVFDASIWQLLLPLINGNCTVIAPPSLGFDLPKIIDLIEKFKVTIAGFVPSIFNLLVERLEQHPKIRQRLQSLRLLIIGGEAINSKAIYRFKSYLPGVEITNGYGPTETSISVIFYDIPSVFTEPIPIGKPLFNVQALILDENLNLVPIGVPGELYIGGVCVGLGYLNNEAATSCAFIPNPFSEINSDRLYKTGDLARYLPDGNIEFLGRIDRQVKIRGIRIELGEIEATLAQHPDLREAVVTVREDTPANKHLVAYVVPNGAQPTIAQLRSFLKTKLPDYMVPSAFVVLERMPLTPNGKIDRRAFPAPDTYILSQETGTIPPRNTLELQLAQIWSEVLNIPSVGVRDNFFDLGGHSLLAVRLMACIEQQLGTYLPLATLFTEPTIEHQASLLSTATDAQRSSPLVPIRQTGSLPPLFCVHPIGGDVLCYATLARHLGETQPFWALRSLGLDGECQPLTRIEDMAATYIKALQTIQPEGPYHLAGWSMGGIVAFEMATQLVASGHDVSLLAVIDSDAPIQTFQESLSIDEAMLLVDWVKNLNGLSHKALSVSIEQLRRLAPQEQLPYVVKQAQHVELLPKEIGQKQASSLFKVFKANRLSLSSYRPQPYPGRITLLCSTEDSGGERLEPTLGWGELSTSGIDIHRIASDHFSIVQTRRLAELLSRITSELSSTAC
jgi:amino acid adenylation domain-containing protein/FkbH-like protein